MQFRGGMNELVRQAARMQRKVDQIKEEIKDRESSATSAGDKVKVTVTCEGKLTRIEVDPEFARAEAADLVYDAIVAAANAALKIADEFATAEIAKVTGGVKIPGISG